MIQECKFNNVSELFDYIMPWKNEGILDGFIFRGHAQESYRLVPSALREDKKEDLWKRSGYERSFKEQSNFRRCQIEIEQNLLREFYKLADRNGLNVPHSKRFREILAQDYYFYGANSVDADEMWIPEELLETAALAQHYGIPTRLLDWTYDPLIALFFAFHDAMERTGNLAIWAIDKERICRQRNTHEQLEIEFVTPPYFTNQNLSAQKGLFTHWPIKCMPNIAAIFSEDKTQTDRRPLDELISSSKNYASHMQLFKKMILPCSEAKEGCRILDKLEYDRGRVFPGYDGIAKHVLARHNYK